MRIANCILYLIFILHANYLQAQFAGPAGTIGSTAISKDSNCISFWANSAIVKRGLKNVSDSSLGFVSAGDSTSIIGKAGENGTLSLGDNGSVIIGFEQEIKDVQGFDFAVFENGLNDQYLELAFVDVSFDDEIYYRFPAHYLSSSENQIGPFDAAQHATEIDGLAGKYRVLYGTPFDINLLRSRFPNLNKIKKIKITDVCGSILPQWCQRDSAGNIINDPWPTPFETGGFDLDAIAALNQFPSYINEQEKFIQTAYKEQFFEVFCYEKIKQVSCYNLNGEWINLKYLVQNNSIQLMIDELPRGIYALNIQTENKTYVIKMVSWNLFQP